MKNFNFKCRHCKSEFFEPSFSIGYKEGEDVYKDKRGNKLKCPYCESEKVSIIEEKGEFNINYSKFGSLPDSEKKNILRKRADKHQKGKLEEKKKYINRKILGYES